MATIKKTLSTKTDGQGYSQILIRLSLNRDKKLRLKSGIFIPTKRWDTEKERITDGKAVGFEKKDLIDKNARLKSLEARILKLCEGRLPETIDKEWMERMLTATENIEASNITDKFIKDLEDKEQNPDKYKKQPFFVLMDSYMENTKNMSKVREANFRVVQRSLQRYEWFIQLTDDKKFKLEIDTFDSEILNDFVDFLRNEYKLYEEYPHIYKKFPANTDTRKSPKPKPRGSNAIVILLKKFRAFYNWCIKQGFCDKTPFTKYNGTMTEKYGTPYYITLEERNLIADYDFSHNPVLMVQRDIFIFQCCIGCRISDLMRLTEDNIIDGEIQYVPQKTRGENPTTVKVPLNSRAIALVEKYKGQDKKGRLFPFFSEQRYNEHIKEIFKECGITRMVTILNPTTGIEEQRPINEVASSHMARRTFVGNLYKKVKDPNLICPMSGHKIGSAAFARYKEVDKELRVETIKLID